MKYPDSPVQFKSQIFSIKGVEPFAVFSALSALSSEHFFLEGFEEWDGESDYCLVGIDPFETLVIRDKKLEIFRSGNKSKPFRVIEGDPFHSLTNHLSKYHCSKPSKKEISFRGGAVGYIGYDCARFFEKSLVFKKADAAKNPEACLILFRKIIAVARDGTHVVVTSNIFKDDDNDNGNGRSKSISIQEIEKVLGKLSKLEKRI